MVKSYFRYPSSTRVRYLIEYSSSKKLDSHSPNVDTLRVTVSSGCDHIGFRYHLKDVIVGKIYFLLVRIKIQHMELQIIKRETTGTGECLRAAVAC